MFVKGKNLSLFKKARCCGVASIVLYSAVAHLAAGEKWKGERKGKRKKMKEGRRKNHSLQSGGGDIHPRLSLAFFIFLFLLRAMASADDRLNIHAQLEHLQVRC